MRRGIPHAVLAFALALLLAVSALVGQSPAHTDADRERPVALWIGDSYTAGTGARSVADSYAAIASKRMGWYYRIDAQGGTGFTANGPPKWGGKRVPERLRAARSRYVAEIVIVDAGRNDHKPEVAKRAISDYLPALREAWPLATLVVIVPWFAGSTIPHDLAEHLRSEAEAVGALVEDPFANGWVGPHLTGRFTADGVHPNEEGYQLIAEHLVADFSSMNLDVEVTADTIPAS